MLPLSRHLFPIIPHCLHYVVFSGQLPNQLIFKSLTSHLAEILLSVWIFSVFFSRSSNVKGQGSIELAGYCFLEVPIMSIWRCQAEYYFSSRNTGCFITAQSSSSSSRNNRLWSLPLRGGSSAVQHRCIPRCRRGVAENRQKRSK